jgi:hypothetical protein
MPFKPVLFTAIVSFCAGAAICHYFYPPKEISTTRDVVQTRVVTVVQERKLPDGTTETSTTTTDNSTRANTSESTKPVPQSNWHISAGAGLALQGLVPTYSFSVQRRVLGPFFLGATYTTPGTGLITIGVEF